MEHITDWLMVIITALYFITTIIICVSNHKSAKAAKEAVEESKRQFEQSIQLQKQHNYDSVRPAVSIDFASSDSEDTFSGSIIVTNHGLGPAILKELKFKKNKKEYINTNGYCTIYDLISFRIAEENEQLPVKAVFNHCQYYSKELRNDDNRDYLAVGDKLILL